jgi:hypothetical protein
MTPEEVLALAREHADSETALDADRTMATLGDDPRYEFYPARLQARGRAIAERYYREEFPRFLRTHARAGETLGEWATEDAAVLEHLLTVDVDGVRKKFHVLTVFPVRGGRFAGERLYCDDELVRLLLGDLYDLLEPIPETN